MKSITEGYGHLGLEVDLNWRDDEEYNENYDDGKYKGERLKNLGRLEVIDKEGKGRFPHLRSRGVIFSEKNTYIDDNGNKVRFYEVLITIEVLLSLFKDEFLGINEEIQRALSLNKERAQGIIKATLQGRMIDPIHINAYQKIVDAINKNQKLRQFMSLVDGQHRQMAWYLSVYVSSQKKRQFNLPDFEIRDPLGGPSFNLKNLKSLIEPKTNPKIPSFVADFIEENFFQRKIRVVLYENLSMLQESDIFIEINSSASNLSDIDLVAAKQTSIVKLLRAMSHDHSDKKMSIFVSNYTGNQKLDWNRNHYISCTPFLLCAKAFTVWYYYGRGKRRPMEYGVTPKDLLKFYENEVTEISDSDWSRFVKTFDKFFKHYLKTLNQPNMSAYWSRHKITDTSLISRTLDKFAFFLLVENNHNQWSWFKGVDQFNKTSYVNAIMDAQDSILKYDYDFDTKEHNDIQGESMYKKLCGKNNDKGVDNRVDYIIRYFKSQELLLDMGVVTLDKKDKFDRQWQEEVYLKELKQKGKVLDAFTNEEIVNFEDLEGDHNIPHCWGIENGGTTSESNYCMTLKSTNNAKRRLSGDELTKILDEEGKYKNIVKINNN